MEVAEFYFVQVDELELVYVKMQVETLATVDQVREAMAVALPGFKLVDQSKKRDT